MFSFHAHYLNTSPTKILLPCRLSGDRFIPQFKEHQFLECIDLGNSQYEYTLAVAVQYKERWYHAGTACLIAGNLAISAKHLIEWIYLQVAQKRIDLYDPEMLESRGGYTFHLPKDLGIDLFQFQNGSLRRFSVTGFYNVGFKTNDLILFRIEPHTLCPYRAEEAKFKLPTLDLIPPQKKSKIFGFGFPNHPDHLQSILPENHYSDYFLYASEGDVQAINSEVGSAPIVSFQTSMKTLSGMSGGPVFVRRNDGNYFCGIISRGDQTFYSLISPLWTMLAAQIHPVQNLKTRYGATCILDIIQAGKISANDGNRFHLLDYVEEQEFRIMCDSPGLLKVGY